MWLSVSYEKACGNVVMVMLYVALKWVALMLVLW
jgi:hypothetical protein